ncbi:hypothetical protein [Mucilaginibacter sp.]|uniref:hypothetical protein n=1 Tax=Mucilaginibacter sp. TaxID=1882438 RepID=UPI0032643C45
MKTKFLKHGLLLAAMAATTLSYGQAKKKTVRDNSPNSNYMTPPPHQRARGRGVSHQLEWCGLQSKICER